MIEWSTKGVPSMGAGDADTPRPVARTDPSAQASPTPNRRHLDPMHAGAAAFQALSEKCFLTIHWEIRIRVLHYLHKSFIAPRIDLTAQEASEETERRVGLLVGDLWSISRIISHMVSESKFNFFYRSLATLLRDIFMRSVDQMIRINGRER